MQQNPMEVFQKEAPEVAAAFNGLIMSLVASKGIDPKTKQLIYIAMKASMGDEMAVRAGGRSDQGRSGGCDSYDPDGIGYPGCRDLSPGSCPAV
jgi:hypothetical protein